MGIIHEFSLAKAAKETILSNYKGAKKVLVLIGQIQWLDQELFKYALKQEIENLHIEVEYQEIPAKFKCNICLHEFYYSELNLDDEQKENIHFVPETIYIFVKCPKCGSSDFDIIQGRGVFIKAIDENK